MFCTKCGFELPEGTVFCTSCGARQEQPVVESENLQEDKKKESKIVQKWNLKKTGAAKSGDLLTGDKKKRRKLIGGCVAGVAVIGLIAGTVVLNQPKIKLMRSAYKTYRDAVKTESGIGAYLGLKDIVKEIQTGKTHQELLFSGKQDGERIGVKSVLNMDKKSGETAIQAFPMYKDSELTELLVYRNQERTVMAAPDLYDGSFYFNNEDAARKFRESALNSYLKQLTGIGLEDDGDLINDKDRAAIDGMMNRFLEQSSGTLKQMGKNITVEKIDSKNFTINGKSKKCKGYEVTIPKKDMKNVLKEAAKFVRKDDSVKKIISYGPMGYPMGLVSAEMVEYRNRAVERAVNELDEAISDLESNLEDDLVVILYTGPKGRLVSMESEYEFTIGRYETPVALTVSLLGAGNPLDMVELECDFAQNILQDGYRQSDRYTISLLREQTYNKSSKQLDDTGEVTVKNIWNDSVYTDKLSYGLSLNQKSGVWDLSLKADDSTVRAEGTLADVKKGNGFTLVLDKLKFDNSYMPVFEGQYVVGPLGKEPVNMIPEDLGEEIDLFDMGISEVQKIGENVAKKLTSKIAKAGLERLTNGIFGSRAVEPTTAETKVETTAYSY